MPKAEKALKSAPGVLAVKIDFATGKATIGTQQGEEVPKAEILAALSPLRYRGEFVNQ